MTVPRVKVASWRPSMFVDGWAFAVLVCGHKVEQKNRRRPKSKLCHRCWIDGLKTAEPAGEPSL